jgi:hypothetical protein
MTVDTEKKSFRMDKDQWIKLAIGIAMQTATLIGVFLITFAALRADVRYNRRDIDTQGQEIREIQKQQTLITQTLNENLARIAGDVGEIKGRLGRE